MARYGFIGFEPAGVPSPCFVVDRSLLEKNLECLAKVQRRSKAKILMALKGFSMYSLFPLIKKYLPGVCASGLHEALLGREFFGKEVHTYSPAYKEAEFKEIMAASDHIIFNSFSQWHRFKDLLVSGDRKIEAGLRINPEVSTAQTACYDPCGEFSRLGITLDQFEPDALEGISGLHFHALCEQDAEDFVKVADVFEEKFRPYLKQMKWLNFGGGHWITKPGYNIDLLCETLLHFRKEYDVRVYLEPGEAVVINTGVLVGTVLDVVRNGMDIAILDTSASTHMPDVLEMPYRPDVWGAAEKGVKKYTYRLGGPSCLAGDVIGDYSFPEPLKVGQRVVLDDMSHYTMVKTTTFNGVKLPGIGIYDSKTREFELVKEFGYADFKERLS